MRLSDEDERLKEFIDLLSGLRGIAELKVWTETKDVWIGLRAGRQRTPHILLQQVTRVAIGFGLDIKNVHFGILAD